MAPERGEGSGEERTVAVSLAQVDPPGSLPLTCLLTISDSMLNIKLCGSLRQRNLTSFDGASDSPQRFKSDPSRLNITSFYYAITIEELLLLGGTVGKESSEGGGEVKAEALSTCRLRSKSRPEQTSHSYLVKKPFPTFVRSWRAVHCESSGRCKFPDLSLDHGAEFLAIRRPGVGVVLALLHRQVFEGSTTLKGDIIAELCRGCCD
ncbi:hypothetical protein AAG570_010908 [Ranatra chinensis]|uniref:Uncharacterized protein n=1 Tax=Ranatra chinensis TaxID=642074 RepID=A0ABD0YJB5_9HEMI